MAEAKKLTDLSQVLQREAENVIKKHAPKGFDASHILSVETHEAVKAATGEPEERITAINLARPIGQKGQARGSFGYSGIDSNRWASIFEGKDPDDSGTMH